MAEFCKKCFLEHIYTLQPNEEIVLTDYDDFCESCGIVGPVVDHIEHKHTKKESKKMGVFFPNIELPTGGCQLCRFAPIVYTPSENGIIKEQICLVKKELVQSCIVQDESEFPDEWWYEKHLECPGIPANIVEDEHTAEENAEELIDG